jgi:hypothetical protein
VGKTRTGPCASGKDERERETERERVRKERKGGHQRSRVLEKMRRDGIQGTSDEIFLCRKKLESFFHNDGKNKEISGDVGGL